MITMLEHFLYEPVPKRGTWLYTLGSATLFTIVLQFLTGILLLYYYVPTTDHAWNSIYYIMHESYFGWLIRGIHYWSANFLLVVIGLHMFRVYFSGAYKAPRELNWVVGVALLLLVVVIAFSGYVLRWDQDGFWATGVHLYLLRRHGEFGSEFEYADRLARLHERQRLEAYERYEEEEGEP